LKKEKRLRTHKKSYRFAQKVFNFLASRKITDFSWILAEPKNQKVFRAKEKDNIKIIIGDCLGGL